jgi:para-nitrobenzyl esterase
MHGFVRIFVANATLMFLVLTVAIARATTVTASSPIVTTEDGEIHGVRHNGVREFLGIPYAAPPVRNLRWRPPEAHVPWKTVLQAGRPGPSCPQVFPGAQATTGTEDCLFLNIYAPDAPRNGLPVMFWIHGGAFIFGSGTTYDGSTLARKHKFIVVTINYRLGALGFLALAQLDADSPDHVSGNYGLLDQQAALKWVRRNISAFGGNPNKVTIAGESAGGISICAQLASPAASGLFRGAINESGPCLPQPTIARAEERGGELVTKLGCDKAVNVAVCLRSKSADQVVSAMPGSLQGPLVWTPVIDGHVMPKQAYEAFRDGSFNKVPVINGSNRDEGTLFIALGKPLPAQYYAAAVAPFASVGSLAQPAANRTDAPREILTAYPISHFQSPSQGLAAVLGDAIFSCPIETTGELLSGSVPVYQYEFNDRHAPLTFIAHPPFPLGAYHASEIQYVFQTSFVSGGRSELPGFSAAQQRLSDSIMSYWSTFITTGKPDGASPAWLPEKPGQAKILSLSPNKIRYESDFATVHHCALWNSLQRQ